VPALSADLAPSATRVLRANDMYAFMPVACALVGRRCWTAFPRPQGVAGGPVVYGRFGLDPRRAVCAGRARRRERTDAWRSVGGDRVRVAAPASRRRTRTARAGRH